MMRMILGSRTMGDTFSSIRTVAVKSRFTKPGVSSNKETLDLRAAPACSCPFSASLSRDLDGKNIQFLGSVGCDDSCEPQRLCADCVALGILSLLAGMAADDGDSRGQWLLSRNPCSPHASLRERRRLGHGHAYGRSSAWFCCAESEEARPALPRDRIRESK